MRRAVNWCETFYLGSSRQSIMDNSYKEVNARLITQKPDGQTSIIAVIAVPFLS
jgi:hypothetical protein